MNAPAVVPDAEAGVTGLTAPWKDSAAEVKSDLGAALHEAAGYELEATRRDSLRRDGSYVDELALAKLHDAAVV